MGNCETDMNIRLIELLQYVPTLLNSTNIDEYVVFDKWSLVIQCYQGMIEACYRGLGM
jgi:hypothetical protein